MELVFIHPNDKERSLYRIYLENILDDCVIIEFFSFKQAQEFLNKKLEKNERPCDFILAATENKSKDDDVVDFYLFCDQHLFKVPFISMGQVSLNEIPELGEEQIANHQTAHIMTPISPADFRKRILSILFPDRMRLEPVAAFQKVRLFNFYRYNKTHCHIYIKLGRLKYVKVLNKDSIYTRADLDKLKEKDVEYLYIRNDDFQRFQVNYFHNNFLEFDSELSSPQELKEKLEFTHAMLQEIVTRLGFSDSAIELTEKSLKAIYGIVEKDLTLTELLRKFSQRNDYLYDHSYLTSIIGCDLLRKMNWFTEDRLSVLGFASLFHDITIKDQQMAKISSCEDERLNHSEAQRKKYLRHPIDALELISNYPNIPQKVGVVISQHHENPEGHGFPHRLRPQELDPLSAVFIIAHEFVNSLERLNFAPEKVGEITQQMASRFKKGHFKRPMDAFLEKVVKAA